ncbi:polyprenyl diphosphate synthase [Cycloclasticus pugetii]|uniref:polyprenyl diphosphate synthase n=1 Tax=Cycloclasticus pugetii TaxID=34068 RepID=UPI00240920C6|nr:polyprenyl diphosphate synthase [Cycloclasticus pugetii]MDF1828864.1 polyprenyl diphosphate synthase [Cycloclasticus pugetii]
MTDNQVKKNIKKSPKHIAIIMDGNGRWATAQGKPRTAGHKAGVDALRTTIETCASYGVEVLTVFAFSSENWRRPAKEVNVLMDLFMLTLKTQAKRLHNNNIRLKIIGDKTKLSQSLQQKIIDVELLTAENTGLLLVIAANYGGQWDITQASQCMMAHAVSQDIPLTDLNIEDFLSTAAIPDPDLFIRTGGEQRISNFLLWQIAYSELYFTDTLWPDFDKNALDVAIQYFSSRERRFGQTGEQLHEDG